MKIIRKLKKDSFYKDLIITFIGQFIAMIITFLLNKVISNLYTVEDFGIYNIIKRFTSIISSIMLMSMGIAIPKFVAESKEKRDKLLLESYIISSLLIIFTVSIFIIVFLLLFQNQLSIAIFGKLEYKVYIFPIILYSLGTCLITHAYSYYRGINNFIKYNAICIFMQLVILITSFIFNDDLYILYIIWGIFLIVYALIEWIIIFKINKFSIGRLREKIFSIKELLVYTVPRVPGEIILFAYTLLPLSIVSYKFGLKQVAYLSSAISINTLITPLFSLVGSILLPLVSKSIIAKKYDEINSKLKSMMIIYIFISSVSILFILLLDRFLVILLYNSMYLEALPLIQITSFSILPNSIYLLLRNPLDGMSGFPYNSISLLISFIVYILLLIIAPNIEFCAISMTISYIILGLLTFFFWRKLTISI